MSPRSELLLEVAHRGVELAILGVAHLRVDAPSRDEELLLLGELHGHVGLEALLVRRDAAREVVGRDGEGERTTERLERDHALHRALAERLLADQRGDSVLAER